MINSLRSSIVALRKLGNIFNKKQKRRALVVFIITFICSLFELLGVTVILPFLKVLVTPDELLQSGLIKKIVEVFSIQSHEGLILLTVVGIILVYIIKNLYIIWAYYIQYGFSSSIQKELSVKMLRSYMNRPYSFFLNVNSGELLRGCNDDTRGVYYILSSLFSIISEFFSMLLIGMYVFVAEPLVALAMMALVGVVAIGIIGFLKPLTKRIGKKNLEAYAIRNKTIFQALNGIKEIYVTQRKEYFTREYNEASGEVAKVDKLNSFLTSIPERIIEGVCISGIVGIIAVRIIIGGDALSFIPKLGTFAMAAFKILPSVGKITNRINSIVYFMPCLDNVYRIIDDANKYQLEQAAYVVENANEEQQSNEPLSFEHELSITDMCWRYPKKEEYVLNGISLSIHKGESVALIGASGAGKTTLADVIMGLLKPQRGTVLLDGIDIFAYPKRWANTIGYVPQQVFLIDDTVRANVTFGLRDYTDEEVWDALERAQLKPFIEGLPDGLDTIVGERGVKFSGGQRQRIAIARALFAKPQILVLDEATAALDNETESAVMESIDALQGHITLIIVAHRLSTIRNCDRIYEICDGVAQLRSKEEVIN